MNGVAEWIVAGNFALPALGLTRGPQDDPVWQQSYALLTHAAFGAVLESARALTDGKRFR